MPRVISLIPARGGSKSIPKKNIKPFNGKPLIAYSIEASLSVPMIERTIVSTDSLEIAEISRQAGAEVPFIRPEELARDDTPDLPVFEHCLHWLRENEDYVPDLVVQLRPTTPIRDPDHIKKGIEMLIGDPEADSLRAVCEPTQNPFKMWKLDSEGYLVPIIDTDIKEAYNQPRQKLPIIYWQNGYLDIVRSKTILQMKSMTGRKIRPLVIGSEYVFDIDNLFTFKMAEFVHRQMAGEVQGGE